MTVVREVANGVIVAQSKRAPPALVGRWRPTERPFTERERERDS